MTDYETILQTTLKGLTENFELAHSELHQAVAKLAKAVQSVTNGTATLALEASQNENEYNEDYVCYSLIFQTGSGYNHYEKRILYEFMVPMGGYPIELFKPVERQNSQREHSIKNGVELDMLFKKMISDKNSPLMSILAYTIRNRITNPQSSGSPPEDIPF